MRKTDLIKIALLGIIPFSLCLTGCGRKEPIQEPIADNQTFGWIDTQTSDFAISQAEITQKNKSGESPLSNGWYYIVHEEAQTQEETKGWLASATDKLLGKNDGENKTFYPVVNYKMDTYESEAPKDFVDPSRIAFFTTENEHNIPTLFLGQGDKLYYYSTDTLLDYIVWERYYDMKYTIGVWNLSSMVNGRIYLELSEDKDYILPESELYDLYTLEAPSLLFDKIGGIPITSDMIDSGLLMGATRYRQYDLEIYTGTQYKHYLTTANIKALRAYELFASTEYETKQGYLYEIAIPDYLPDGFYNINNTGYFRLIRGSSYNDSETDYNERVLFPSGDTNSGYISEKTQASIDAMLERREKDIDWEVLGYPAIYSTNKSLNRFSTRIEGKLGYVDSEMVEEEKKESPIKEEKLTEATVTTLPIFFPKGVTAKITVSSAEPTGHIFVQIGTDTYSFSYDELLKDYTREFTFRRDTYGTLSVQGLFQDYKISFTDCEQKTDPALTDSKESELQTLSKEEK